MKIVGVNGFGRIGRCFTRLALMDPTIDVALVNDLADITTLAHLLKYDSVRGGLNLSFTIEGNSILFSNGKKITFVNEKNPEDIDWTSYNVNYVLESSGLFLSKESAGKHLKPGVKKVILSAPPSHNDIKSIVLGVNEGQLSTEDLIISNASCTTNNVAPMIKVLMELFPIDVAYISTIHSYTSDQRLHDSPHKDLRRARAAAMSIIPTSTGAAKAITQIFPKLKDKITGGSVRVPVSDGSMTELTLITSKKITVEEINLAMKNACEGDLKGIMTYTEDPIVSVDVLGNPTSCVFDSGLTVVFNNMVKVVGWYDNEMGYSSRLIDLIKIL